jgi:hypothetical protein
MIEQLIEEITDNDYDLAKIAVNPGWKFKLVMKIYY